MKKIIKLIIFILLFSFSFKVTAKELVEEEIMDKQGLCSSNSIIKKDLNNNIVSIGYAGCEYLGKKNEEKIYLSKFDGNGVLIDQYLININIDNFYDFLPVDGGYIISAHISSDSSYLIKLDYKGNIIWTTPYEDYFVGSTLNYSSNDTFIATGAFAYEEYMISGIAKYSYTGECLWVKSYEDYSTYLFKSAATISNGNFMVIGFFDGYEYRHNRNVLLLFDSDGNPLETISDSNYYYDKVVSIGDYFYVSGAVTSSNYKPHSSLRKFGSDGSFIDEKFIWNNEDSDFIENLITFNDKIVITNWYSKFNSNYSQFENSIYVIVLDIDFNEIYNFAVYEGVIVEDYINTAKAYFIDNKIIFSYSHSPYNLYMNLYDLNGNLIKENKHTSLNKPILPYVATNLKNDNVVILGYTPNNIPIYYNDALVIRLYDPNTFLKKEMLFTKEPFLIFHPGEEAPPFTYGGYFTDAFGLDDLSLIVSGNSYIQCRNNKCYSIGFISKHDKDLNKIWYKNISNHQYSISNKMILLSDSFIVVGAGIETTNKNEKVGIISKYDMDGNIIWSKEYNADEMFTEFDDISVLKDGTYLVTGRINNEGTNTFNNIIIRYDSNGNVIYEKNIENNGDLSLINSSTNDGGYIIIKNTSFNNSNTKVITSKYDKNNNELWSKEIIHKNGTEIYDITELDNNLFILDGYYVDDLNFQRGLIVTFDNNGNDINYKEYGNEYTTFYKSLMMSNGTIRNVGRKTFDESNTLFYDIYYLYEINIKGTKNGTFTIDKRKAKNKEIITINAKPKLGYVVDKVILTDTKGNKTEFKNLTFEMIPDDVEVEVLFKELINPKTGFSITSIITMIGVLLYFTLRKKRKA